MKGDFISRSALFKSWDGLSDEIKDPNLLIDEMIKRTQEALAVDAESVRHEGCEFCKRFDFSEARCEVTKKYAHISFACGSTRFPKPEQFKFCPNCGKKMDAKEAEK